MQRNSCNGPYSEFLHRFAGSRAFSLDYRQERTASEVPIEINEKPKRYKLCRHSAARMRAPLRTNRAPADCVRWIAV